VNSDSTIDSDGGGLAREAADPDREQAHASAREHVDRREALGQPTGWWKGNSSTPVPSRIVVVDAATKARHSRGSAIGRSGANSTSPTRAPG
jgi:hypothetical protein